MFTAFIVQFFSFSLSISIVHHVRRRLLLLHDEYRTPLKRIPATIHQATCLMLLKLFSLLVFSQVVKKRIVKKS